MMTPQKKNKLQKLLSILTPDKTQVDFSEFDSSIDTLKKGLKEKIQVQTLDDVNRKLSDFQKKFDLSKVEAIAEGIRVQVESKIGELTDAVEQEKEALMIATKSGLDSQGRTVEQIRSDLDLLAIDLKTLSSSKAIDLVNSEIAGLKDLSTNHLSELTTLAQKLEATNQSVGNTENALRSEIVGVSGNLEKIRLDLSNRINNLPRGGGNANRQINVGSSVMSTKYTDINLKAGTNVTLSKADNNTTKQVDITIAASGGGGGGGDISSVLSGTGIVVDVTTPNTPIVNLGDTSVTTGTYGTNITVPRITVDQQGRISAASTVGITFPTDRVSSVVAGTAITVNNTNPIAPVVALGTASVTAGTYGSATQVGQFTVDAQGRLQAASIIGISGGNVTKVGTPVNNQVGVWTGDGTIEGASQLTYDSAISYLKLETASNPKNIVQQTGGAFATLFSGASLSIFQFSSGHKFGIQAASAIDNDGSANYTQMSFGDTRRTIFGDMAFSQTDLGGGRVQILDTVEQLRIAYNSSNYLSATVGSAGSTTFNLTGTSPEFIFSDPVQMTSLQTDAIVNDTGLAHGTYTPTRSAEANMDANVTMTEAQYMRVGNTVTVSGRFTADPTLATTATSFEITLPVATNIGAAEDAAGVAFCGTIAGMGAEVIGVVANDTAKIQWVSSDVTSKVWSYTFTYQVI